MYQIKQLDAQNTAQIIAFDKLCFPTDFWKEEDWQDLLRDKRAAYYALLDSDNIVGDVFIYNWQGEKDYVKIMNIAVHPNYRNQGLASRLLNHAAKEMERLGMFRFCGETRASNRAMQKVFTNCGYALNKVEENYYHNPEESAWKYVLQGEKTGLS